MQISPIDLVTLVVSCYILFESDGFSWGYLRNDLPFTF
jgi:hypothetical protein